MNPIKDLLEMQKPCSCGKIFHTADVYTPVPGEEITEGVRTIISILDVRDLSDVKVLYENSIPGEMENLRLFCPFCRANWANWNYLLRPETIEALKQL